MGKLPKWVQWASLAIVNIVIVAIIAVLVTNGLDGQTTITPTPTPTHTPTPTPTPLHTPVAEHPDLVVTDMRLSSATPKPFYVLYIVEIDILNQGTKDAEQFHWIWAWYEAGEEIGYTHGEVPEGLDVGNSITVSGNVYCYEEGTFDSIAEVDHWGEVEESNEHNNTYSGTFTCAAE